MPQCGKIAAASGAVRPRLHVEERLLAGQPKSQRGRRAVIDWVKLGYEVEVSLRLTLDKTNPAAFDEVLAEARELPEVIEIQTFLGRVDLRLSVIARDMRHYQEVYRSKILTLPHIADIEALMRVAVIKHSESLPV